MTEPPPRRAVYTAMIGGYESLQEQPVAKTTDIPFVCLTDDPTITSDTWEIRVVEPAFARDAARSSRYPKILGAPLVPGHDETLWIDNRVLLDADPGVVLDELLDGADLAVMYHSFRESVIAEFDEVVRRGLDEPARVYEQLLHYAETRPHVLDQRPYWGGFIARRWTPEVTAAMRTWLDHVLRYSRRDQLSFRHALDGVARVRALDLDNLSSDWHTWITDEASVGRKKTMRTNAFHTSIRAPLAVIAERDAELASLRAQHAEEVAALRTGHAEEVASLRAQLDGETGRADAATASAEDLRRRVVRLRARVARLRRKVDAERARSTRLRTELEASPTRRVRRVAGRVARRFTPGSR